MHSEAMNRRAFLTTSLASVAALSTGTIAHAAPRTAYKGPNVILVRFGGGVRRLETILHPEKTYCPFIYHELYKKRGTLLKNVEIESREGVETSHGQGTLHIITGKYDGYKNDEEFLGERFEPQVPTIFEYLRRTYDIPEYQTLIINGEDRIQEEFYTFSSHFNYGIDYRSTVLSLYRFKTYLLREELKNPRMPEKERAEKQKKLDQMVNQDYRRQSLSQDQTIASPKLDQFWEAWKNYYGRTGFVNPRGDRLLTTLALRSLRELRPKLMMINYNDPDFVHWGPPNFYTRAISIIDEGVRELHDAVQADPEYRDNTVFLVIPDCGRDNNLCQSVPFQHHFGSKSSHQIFAVASGPGIAKSRKPVDRKVQQISMAATLGAIMKFSTAHVDGGAGAVSELLA